MNAIRYLERNISRKNYSCQVKENKPNPLILNMEGKNEKSYPFFSYAITLAPVLTMKLRTKSIILIALRIFKKSLSPIKLICCNKYSLLYIIPWKKKIFYFLIVQNIRMDDSVQFSSVQLLSRVWLFVTPWITARQASLSISNSQSPPKLMSIE